MTHLVADADTARAERRASLRAIAIASAEAKALRERLDALEARRAARRKAKRDASGSVPTTKTTKTTKTVDIGVVGDASDGAIDVERVRRAASRFASVIDAEAFAPVTRCFAERGVVPRVRLDDLDP